MYENVSGLCVWCGMCGGVYVCVYVVCVCGMCVVWGLLWRMGVCKSVWCVWYVYVSVCVGVHVCYMCGGVVYM